MVDTHPSVGAFTVTGKINVGLLDSSDAGDRPDARPPIVADVDITPWRDGQPMTTPLAVLADESVLVLKSYKGHVDADGHLVVPADGDSGPAGTATELRLIATDQTAISETGWSWKFTFTPAAGQGWNPFSVWIRGVPDEVRTIGRAVIEGSASSLARLMAAVVIYGNAIEDVTVDDVPPGTPDGAFCVLLPIGYNPATDPPLVDVPTFIYRA